MERWSVCSKLIVIAYLITIKIYNWDFTTSNNIYKFVLIVLTYVVIDFGYYIINKKYKLYFKILLIAFIIFCLYNVDNFFVFLLPINIFELFYDKLKEYTVLVVLLFTVILVDRVHLIQYLLLSFLLYTSYYSMLNYHKRIKNIMDKKDKINEKYYALQSQTAKDNEYDYQVKYTSQLEERNKISQEIHDKLGHSLSGSIMNLEAARLFIGRDNEKADKMIQNIIDILRNCMNDVRKTLRNIKPPSEQIGINRIILFMDNFKKSSNIETSVLYNGNIDNITNKMWRIIFDNVREALTNVEKYSQASKVTFSINVYNKIIKAEIKDNGVGTLKLIQGLGIRGMEERMINENGELIVDGSNGFSVIMIFHL